VIAGLPEKEIELNFGTRINQGTAFHPLLEKRKINIRKGE
jgi:hypothetical protein